MKRSFASIHPCLRPTASLDDARNLTVSFSPSPARPKRSSKRSSKRRGGMYAIAAASLFGHSAHAATVVWSGTGTNGDWITAANWTGGVAPVSGQALQFGAAGSSGTTLTNTLTSTAFNVAGITFTAAAPAYSMSGSAFTLTAAVVNNSSATETLTTNIALSGNQDFDSTVIGGNLLIGGVVSGSACRFQSNGIGTATLNGSVSNTYTGLTSCAGGGTLVLDYTNMATPTDLVNNASGLNLGNGNAPTTDTLIITGNASGATSQTFFGTQTTWGFTLASYCQGNIVLNPNGGAGTTLALNGSWSRGVNTVVNFDLSSTAGGTMTVTGTNSAIVTGSGGVSGFSTVKDATGVGLAVLSGSSLVRMTGQTPLSATSNALATNFIANTTGTLSWSSGITARSVNSLTVDTTAAAGPITLDLGAATNVLTLTSKALLITGTNATTIQGGQFGANNSELIVHTMGTGGVTIASSLGGGSTTLTKNGPDTLTLAGSNSYTGVTDVLSGTLMAGSAQAFSPSSSLLLLNAPGVFADLNGFNNAVGGLAGAGTIGGTLTNSSATAATVTLKGLLTNPTFGGAVTGNLSLLGSLGGTQPQTFSGSFNPSGTIVNSGAGSGTLIFSGSIGSNVTGIVQNSPTSGMTFSGSNAFTCGAVVKSGTLNVQANTIGTATTSAGTIVLGDSNNTGLAATLNWQNSSATTITPINVVGTGARTIYVTSYLPVFNGAVALDALGSGTATNLNLITNNTGGSDLIFNGGITGLGNLVLQSNAINPSGKNSRVQLNTTAINNVGTITNSGTGTVTAGYTIDSTIGANIGSNVTGVIENSAASGLILAGSNSFSGGATIKAGTLYFQNYGLGAASANVGAVTLGDSANTGAAANLVFISGNINGGVSNSINVVGTGARSIGVTSYSPTFSGAVTLNGIDVTLFSNNTGGSNITFSGGVSGTGNLVLQSNGNETGGNNGIISLNGTAVNNSGTITNSGTGSKVTGSIDTAIGAPVGSNVTAIIESSSNSALNVTGSLAVNSGGTTLVNSNPAGSGMRLTVSGGVGGTGNLILNNNSLVGYGVTVAGAVNNIGSIINSGTGAGPVLISAAIGTNVTGVTENSPLSYVTASGASTYTAPTTVTSGTLKAGVASVANVSGPFGNNSPVTMGTAATAVMDITGYNTQIGSLTGGGTSGGSVTLGAATLSVGGDNTSPAAYAGAISGTGGGLTKIGTGTLTLAGSNAYTGVTTLSAGVLRLQNTAAIASSGTLALNSGTLQLRADTNSSFAPAGPVNIGGNVTIDVGMNVSGTAGTTLSLGAVAVPSAAAYTITFTGSNGYLAGLASLALPNGAGATPTTLTPLGASVIISGNVTNGISTFAGHYDTFTLDGTASGNSIMGTISDATGGSYATGGDTRIIKQNSSTWTLGGGNTYTGPTAVNGGVLIITGTLGNSPVTVSTGTLQLNGASAINQNILTVNNAASIVTESAINALSGSASLTQSNGSVTLSQGNNYTGATTLTGGTLNINSTTALGSGTVNLNGGVIDNTHGGAVTLTNNQPVVLGGNFAFSTAAGTANNNLNLGTGSITMVADRTVTLNGAGALTLGGVITNGADSNRTLTVNNGSGTSSTTALNIGGLALTGSTTARTVIVNGSGNVNVTGAITNGVTAGSALTYSGSGTLTLAGASTYTGATTASSGATVLTGSLGATAITVSSGAAFTENITGAIGSTASLTLNNSATLSGTNTYTGSTSATVGTLTLNGVLGATGITVSGSGALTENSTGVIGSTATLTSYGAVTLTGTNTYTGNTAVNGALLTLNGVLGATNITVTGPGTLTESGTGVFGSSAQLNLNNATATLAGANTATGQTTVNGSTLNLNYGTQNNSKLADGGTLTLGGAYGGSVINLIGGSHIEIVGGTTLNSGASVITRTSASGLRMQGITRNAGATINFSSAGFVDTNTNNLGGFGILGGYATVDATAGSANWATTLNSGASNTTISAFTGYDPFTTSGWNTLNPSLTGSAALAGALTTNSLKLNSSGAGQALDLGAGGLLTLATGGLMFTGSNDYQINNGTVKSAIATNSDLIIQQWGTGSLTMNSVIANGNGTSTLTKAGSGTLILAGANTYTGATYLNAGTTKLSGSGVISVALLQVGGTFDLNDRLQAVDALVGGSNGTILNNGSSASTLTIGALNGGGTFPGVIADHNNGGTGTLGLTKLGTGTEVLNGPNTYTGATNVNGGTLTVNGPLGSLANTTSVTVSGATLNVGDNYFALNNRINPSAALTLGGSNGAGTFSTYRPVVGSQNVDVGSLSIGAGFSSVAQNGGNLGWLNMAGAGASSYTRSPGGTVTFNGGGGVISSSFANTPTGSSISGTGANAILVGAVIQGSTSNFYKGVAGTQSNPASVNDVYASGSNTVLTVDTSLTTGTTQSLIFTSNTAHTLTLGGAFTVESGGIIMGSGTAGVGVIAGAGSLQASSGRDLWILTTSATSTISASIVDDGASTGITKYGTGNLLLSGSNSYNGPTYLDQGTLSLGSVNALGGAGSINFAGPATLRPYGFDISTAKNIVLYGGPNFATVDTNGQTVTLSGAISSIGTPSTVSATTAAFSKIGAGTLILSGSNTFTGNTGVTVGTLDLSNGQALQNSTFIGGAGTLVFDSSVSAHAFSFGGLGGSTNLALTDNASNPVALSLGNNNNAASYSAVLSGSGSLTKVGTGAQILSGANTYTGTTTIGSGTLQIGAAGTTGALSTSSSIVDNGTLLFNRTNAVLQGTDFTATAISGTGALTQAGSSTLTLTASNTYSGTTTVSAGTLQIGNGGTVGSLSTSSAIVDNGTLSFNRTNAVTQGVDFSAAAISGAGALTQAGSGLLTLNAANTFSGVTTITSGTLDLSNSLALQYSIFSGGAGVFVFDSSVSSHAFSFGGLGGSTNLILKDSGSNTVALTVGGNVTSASYSGVLSGSGGLTKIGTGVQTLANTNTYTGGTIIKGGTLVNGASNAIGAAGSTIVLGDSAGNSNAALGNSYNGNNSYLINVAAGTGGSRSINATAGNPNFTGAITLGTDLTINDSDNGTTTFSGGISGTGNLTVMSASTSGNTQFNTNALNFSGTFLNATTSVESGGLTVASVLGANIKGLVQNGATTLILTSSNAFIADTTVLSGALRLDQSQALQNSVANLNGGSLLFGTAITSATMGGLAGNGNLNLVNTNATPAVVALTLGESNSSYASNTLNPVYAGAIGQTTGAASLTKVGSDAQILTGANTYIGATTIGSGTLQIGNGGATGSLSTSSVITDNGTLAFNRSNTVTQGTDFSGSAISGTGALRQAGAGTLILTAANNYTGPTVINSGTLQIGNGGTTGSLATGSVITDNGILVFNRSNAVAQGTDFSGSAISGTGGLRQSGASILTLSAANSYSGMTTLNSGTLALSGAGTLGAATAALTVNGGVLDLGTTSQTVAAMTIAGGATIRNGTLTGASFTSTGGTISATLSGAGSLTHTSGVLSLTGSNNYSGGTTITGGTLQLGNAAALGSASGALAVNGGTLDLYGNSASVGLLSGSAGALITNTVAGTSTLTSSIASGTSTYAGEIADGAGAVVLNQAGSGTVILSGSVMMTGLNANLGSVQLAQSGSIGAINVAAGATVALTAHSGSTYNVLNTSSLAIAGFSSAVSSFNHASVNTYAPTASSSAMVTQPVVATSAAEPASPEAVPEPGVLGLLLTAAIGLLGRRTGRKTFRGE